MSNLRYRSPEDLRQLLRWCRNKRSEKEDKIRKNNREIERLTKENSDMGRAINNIGQKEVWARIYLARKELGEIP